MGWKIHKGAGDIGSGGRLYYLQHGGRLSNVYISQSGSKSGNRFTVSISTDILTGNRQEDKGITKTFSDKDKAIAYAEAYLKQHPNG